MDSRSRPFQWASPYPACSLPVHRWLWILLGFFLHLSAWHLRAVIRRTWMIRWLSSSQSSLTLMKDQFPVGFFLQKARSSFGENAKDALIWVPVFCHFCTSFPLLDIGLTATGFVFSGPNTSLREQAKSFYPVLSIRGSFCLNSSVTASWLYVSSFGYACCYTFTSEICVCGCMSLTSIEKKVLFF